MRNGWSGAEGGATRLFAGAGLEVAGLEAWLEAWLETEVETKRGGGDVPEAGMGRDALRGIGDQKAENGLGEPCRVVTPYRREGTASPSGDMTQLHVSRCASVQFTGLEFLLLFRYRARLFLSVSLIFLVSSDLVCQYVSLLLCPFFA